MDAKSFKNLGGTAVKKPFDELPGFYENDNRKNRGYNPISKGILEAKYSTLLPENLIQGKSILDLGSCLGAGGQWALFYEASQYVGIEVQDDYVVKSRELLSRWGGKAEVIHSDIRSYLEAAEDESFDIVLAAGVIYCFTDHQEIIRQLCRISSESVVVESNYPQSIRDGNIQNSGLAVTEYTFQQEVNLSDSNESLLGLGATSSINAFDIMFRLNGFSKQEHKLDFPVSEHTIIYNSPMHDEVGIPFRFAVRYVRNDTSTKTRTLEQCLPEKHSLRKNWLQDTDHISRTNKYNQAADKRISNDNKWEFNEEVASRFLEIARREIPDYDRVIEKTIEVANKAGSQSIKIIDVGSATGYTLQQLHDAGFGNLYGVDNSQDMLNQSFDQARLICSDEFPVNEGPFDLVIANWVLHFIPEREQYLKSIRSSLSEQGVLILTEKTMQSNSAQSLYYDFKRGNGVSEQEIQEKQQRLEGVLTAYPLTWYYSALANIGFNQIDILNANHGFVTLMARVNDNKNT